MRNSSFFSNNTYLFLPTRNNPRVALAIDNTSVIFNSFKLYNPFSIKARVLKWVACFCSPILRNLLLLNRNEKSDFILFLEEKIGQKIISSIYYATDGDKIVLQILSQESYNVLGYLKIGVTLNGNIKILNEIDGLNRTSRTPLVESDYVIFSGVYDESNFLFLKEISGRNVSVNDSGAVNLLKELYREGQFYLNDHPRAKFIRQQLIEIDDSTLLAIFDKAILYSKNYYKLVFEHGDFAPWNIKKNRGCYHVFDFEYFVEDGLEFLDVFKYNFQVETLLNKKSAIDVITSLKEKIEIEEFDIIFSIFLIKEIVQETKLGNSTTKLRDILRILVEK